MSWDDNPTSRLSAPFRGTKLQPWQPSCWDPGLVLGCKTPILELPALFVGCIALGYLSFFFFLLCRMQPCSGGTYEGTVMVMGTPYMLDAPCWLGTSGVSGSTRCHPTVMRGQKDSREAIPLRWV